MEERHAALALAEQADARDAERERVRSALGPRGMTASHAIGPGQRIGGERLVASMLLFFGEAVARELDARALAAPAAPPATPTRRPRR